MARSYPPEAIEECRKLFLHHGGKNYAGIERGMHRAGWAGWSAKNLENRGREGTKGFRMGWIEKFGLKHSLELQDQRLVERVNDDTQDLYLGIKTVRKQMQAEAIGKNASKDVRREFREYAKLEIEARRNLDLSRSNLETFAEAYELILTWAPDIDPQLVKLLVKHGDRFADLAQAHYGKAEAVDDGAGTGEDAVGDGPGQDADLDGVDR